MPDEAGLDLQDAASSPMPQNEGNSCLGKPPAQRLLSMDSPGSRGVKGVPPPPPQYVSPRDKKRMKKATDRDVPMSPIKNKAASSGRTAGSNELLKLELSQIRQWRDS